MKKNHRARILHAPISTSAGTFIAHYSEKGLCRLDFPGGGKSHPALSQNLPSPQSDWHERAARALQSVLAGHGAGSLPPMDLSSGSEFQQSVWKALLGIRCGQTASYSEVARQVGRPRAMRAVGGACGANPIPVLVPCHRVLAAHGRLGGFSGGLDWKRRLLEAEGRGSNVWES